MVHRHIEIYTEIDRYTFRCTVSYTIRYTDGMNRCTSCCHSCWCCHLGGGGTQLFSLVQPTAGGVLYLVSLCICAVSVVAANEKTRPSERVRWPVRDSSACRRMCVRPYLCVCVCAVCVSQQVFVAHTHTRTLRCSLARLCAEMCENFNVFAINASVCEAQERAAGSAPVYVCVLCVCVYLCAVCACIGLRFEFWLASEVFKFVRSSFVPPATPLMAKALQDATRRERVAS